MKPPFAFVFVLSLVMSFVVGAVMTIAMTLYNGAHFDPMGTTIQIGIATIIGLVVMLIFPVAHLGEKLAEFYGSTRDGLAWGILQSLVIATVMTFCVSFGMTAFGTGFETFLDGTSFVMRWLIPIPAMWCIAYITTVLALPIATSIAAKAGGMKKAGGGENIIESAA